MGIENMAKDRYAISWNNFPAHLQNSHQDLFQHKLFADVTLVSDDMKQVSAHRTILCSASPIFKQLLTLSPIKSNPILFLKGIMYEDLESLLQFIYLGETKVYEQRIEEFCNLAEDFDLESANLSKNLVEGKERSSDESKEQEDIDTNAEEIQNENIECEEQMTCNDIDQNADEVSYVNVSQITVKEESELDENFENETMEISSKLDGAIKNLHVKFVARISLQNIHSKHISV